VFALILETFGSTELLFILVIALIFFGPRKLPQLARSMGKGLAEFRKASDDFKRTWEREVAMETAAVNSILEEEQQPAYETPQTYEESVIATPNSELVVPRESQSQTTSETSPEVVANSPEITQSEPEPIRKQDWI
jgi:TatA/E family protein of Tat protein translocase